jgi:hypothetical protein
MFTAIHLSPMIPSDSIEQTAQFFQDLFHFSPVRTEANYIILSKDNLSIHILKAGQDIGRWNFTEVEGLDDLWQEIKDNLKKLRSKLPLIANMECDFIHRTPYQNIIIVGLGYWN